MTTFRVNERFSQYLGGRFVKDGSFSGEAFREEHLDGLVEDAVRDKSKAIINFDGVAGMPTSFLEEAFGGLMRKHRDWTLANVQDALEIIAPDNPRLWPFVELAKQFLRNAANLQQREPPK